MLYPALTISIFVHFIFLFLMSRYSDKVLSKKEAPIEINIIELEKATNPGRYIKQLKVQQQLKELRKKTKLLSKKTQTVKKQTIARRSGITKNSASQYLSKKKSKQFSMKKSLKFISQIKKKKHQSISLSQSSNLSSLYSTSALHIRNIQKAEVTALNTKQDDLSYYTFFLRQREKYYPRWVKKLLILYPRFSIKQIKQFTKKPQLTTVQLILDKEGRYVDHFVIRPSQSKLLDQAVISSLKQSAPYPNPPQGLIEEDGFIYLHLSFKLEISPYLSQNF